MTYPLATYAQAHRILLDAPEAGYTAQEVADRMVICSGPSMFRPAKATALECCRELARRGLAWKVNAQRWCGTWNGLPELPPGQLYRIPRTPPMADGTKRFEPGWPPCPEGA